MTAEAKVPATTLGRYQLHKLLGEGGMAEVFLALDTGTLALDRWVAIKRVHRELALEEKFVTMLLDEARLAARIAHPNVAQVIDLGEAEGVPYLVMEYLRGHAFSRVIAKAYELDPQPNIELMCRIVADACEGAHAAHEVRGLDGRAVGLVHRDLSPHNIFVTFDGAVKVMDFGVAKAIGRSTRTAPGTRKGKFSYMAPEQIRGEEVDRRCDVYALGLVLYEATIGEAAFEGIKDHEQRARGAVIESPAQKRAGYPAELEEIVMRALAHRPDERYATARELGQDLERLIVGRAALTDPSRVASLMERLFARGDSRDEHAPSGDSPSSTVTDEDTPQSSPIGVVAGMLAPKEVLEGVPYGRGLGALNVPSTETREAPPRQKASPRTIVSTALLLALFVALGFIPARLMLRSSGTQGDAPRVETPTALTEAPVERVQNGVNSETATIAAPAASDAQEPLRIAKKKRPIADPPGEARASDAMGTLDVRSDPWSNVFVDGRPVQATPIVGLPIRAGTHTVRLVTEDGRQKRARVKIAPGRPATVDVKF